MNEKEASETSMTHNEVIRLCKIDSQDILKASVKERLIFPKCLCKKTTNSE